MSFVIDIFILKIQRQITLAELLETSFLEAHRRYVAGLRNQN
jgi:hypothetical protein